MKAKIVAFAVLILGTAFSRAQDSIAPVNSTTISLSLYFPQGVSRIEPAFRDNAGRMERFAREMSVLLCDTTKMLRGITMSSGASPEGGSTINRRLSDNRMEAVRVYIDRICPGKRCLTAVKSKGVDWEGLERMVESSDMPWRDAVLETITGTPEWVIENGKVVDSRKRRLMRISGGRAWRYMNERFFPDLRGCAVDVSCEFVDVVNDADNYISDDISGNDTVENVISENCVSAMCIPENPDTVPANVDVRTVTADTAVIAADRKGYRLGIGTNLLYDALFIPNISLEFPLAAHWSAGVNCMYGWKERDARRPVYAYGGELHLRYWLKPGGRPLSGHHFGAYGQMLRYNIRHSGRGYLSDRWSYGAGIEYGYSLPLGNRLRIDMAVGAGYLTGICREYVRQDECDVWQATKRRHWFGPTKAEISLVWVIGRVNSTKGGAR